jgi:hypothetical protein
MTEEANHMVRISPYRTAAAVATLFLTSSAFAIDMDLEGSMDKTAEQSAITELYRCGVWNTWPA